MNNNNEDMLISPENIQNTITPSNTEPVSNVESLDVQANNVVDQNVNNSVINTVNSAANEQVQFNNVEPIRDNANIVNNQNAEQKITDINPGNVQSTVSTPVNNYTENNAVSNQNTTNTNPEPTYNSNEQNVDFDNNGVNYYQEGVSNINASKSKSRIFEGTNGAVIFLIIVLVNYFIVSPYIQRYLMGYTFANAIGFALRTNGAAFQGFLAYLFLILLYSYATFCFLLLVLGILNMVKRGDYLYDFKYHLSSIIKISLLVGGIVFLLTFFNLDRICDLYLRIVTLNGYQYIIAS